MKSRVDTIGKEEGGGAIGVWTGDRGWRCTTKRHLSGEVWREGCTDLALLEGAREAREDTDRPPPSNEDAVQQDRPPSSVQMGCR